MSRAFIKELDGDQADHDPPERSQSPHTNYVTPYGLKQLQQRVQELIAVRDSLTRKQDLGIQQQLKHVKRDLRYYAERIQCAVVVRPEAQPDDRVHFGASVEVEDMEGKRFRYLIVGEDEADPDLSKISWVSPLARALLGACIGDIVKWRRPAGDKELKITSISKDSSQ
jgi:transcription elongation GreA/GreB family factor